jgi:hypothetical protein
LLKWPLSKVLNGKISSKKKKNKIKNKKIKHKIINSVERQSESIQKIFIRILLFVVHVLA